LSFTTTVAGRTWHFSHALGRPTAEHNGETGGCLFPSGLALSPDGILFILNRGQGQPTFSDNPSDFYRRIGKTTVEEEHFGDFARYEFTWPSGIAVAGDGIVYAADEYDNVISYYDPDATIPFPDFNPDGERLGDWGESGSEPGQLDGPAGLAFDSADDLYVVDSRNDRVQKFTKDGTYLMGWGRPGSGEGEFNRPWGITISRAGDVYVADWGNNRIQKFTPEGKYLATFGSSSGYGGDLDHPADVAVDSEGDVYVADWGNRRIQIYEPTGDVITALYGDAREPSKAGAYVMGRDVKVMEQTTKTTSDHPGLANIGRFGLITSVVVDGKDRIIASDSWGRLQVYVKDPDYEPAL